MKISVLQMKIVIGDFTANALTLKRIVAEAMAAKPDVLLLPELWDIGFFPKPLADHADENGLRAKELLSSLAKKYSVNIVGGSIAEKCGDIIKNTCYIFDRTGKLIADYAKTHLFSPAKEHHLFTAGDKLTVFELDNVKCGVVICYDLRFPELCRKLALMGADVLFAPAEWPTVRRDHWRTVTKMRAIDNQYFVACANGNGAFANGIPLTGHSAIIDPWGNRLAEADETESVITAELDFAVLKKLRENFNIIADRRPELY